MDKLKLYIIRITAYAYYISVCVCTPMIYLYGGEGFFIRHINLQQQIYKGKVVSDDGTPLSGASVKNMKTNALHLRMHSGSFQFQAVQVMS